MNFERKTVSMGPEMKILRDELKRQIVQKENSTGTGYEDQVIWAINSLEKALVKYNYEVRSTYHKDWRHKPTPGCITPAERYGADGLMEHNNVRIWE